MANRFNADRRLLAALRDRLLRVINEDAWRTPDVAAEIGPEAIPILLDVAANKYEAHPHAGIDIRDWLSMPATALARVGQAHLDRFVAEVTSRQAEDSLSVLWAIWMMRGIPADRVAQILSRAMQTTTGNHPEETRTAAINALAVHRHPSAVEPIIGALEDPDQMVRFAAVRALRAYRDRRSIEPLRTYVRNSDNRRQSPGGVAEALEAIGEIQHGR